MGHFNISKNSNNFKVYMLYTLPQIELTKLQEVAELSKLSSATCIKLEARLRSSNNSSYPTNLSSCFISAHF